MKTLSTIRPATAAALFLGALAACRTHAPTRSQAPTASEPPPAAAATNAIPTAAAIETTRGELRSFGTTYGYDVGYLEKLLDLSPGAQRTFNSAMAMADYREKLPVDAHFVGLLSALMADDCGACTQLNLKMAVEAGVDRGLLRQLLQDPSRLPAPLALVHSYATQVVKGKNVDAATLAGITKAYGDAGLGELAVNVLGARIYPALRRSMGAEYACPMPTVDF
jgi:hypothetical protein